MTKTLKKDRFWFEVLFERGKSIDGDILKWRFSLITPSFMDFFFVCTNNFSRGSLAVRLEQNFKKFTLESNYKVSVSI
jgi:hypothetical protein